MKTALLRWLAPPVFSGDEEKTRRASLLNAVLLLMMVLVAMMLVGNALTAQTPPAVLVLDGAGLVIIWLLRAWLFRSRVAHAGIGLLALSYAAITTLIAVQGGVDSPPTATYVLVMIIAVVLFDQRGLLGATLACSLAILGLILAEDAGLLPPHSSNVTLAYWIGYSSLFGVVGGVAYIANHTVLQALRESRHESQVRGEVETRMRQLLRAVEQSPASIVITNLQGTIEYVNPRFSQVTGYAAEEAIGQNPRILKTERTTPGTHQSMWQALTAGQEWRGEFVNRRKDGTLYHELAIISPLTDPDGKVTHYLAVKEDITARKQMENELRAANEQLQQRMNEVGKLQTELREQALHDALTGLYNRRFVDETLALEIPRAARAKMPLSLVLTDIDHFKTINDTYGHAAGDQLLVHVAHQIQSSTRKSDLACRLGGDEFLLVMPGASLEIAKKRANELRELVASSSVIVDGAELRITLSVGVATFPLHGGQAAQVFINADKALYRSKDAGRNRVTASEEE